jgi:uncharacterized protein (DUF2147 family)
MIRFIFIFLTVTCFSTATFVTSDISGTWLNQDGDAHIKIFESKGKYFGQIVWLKIPNDPETGKPKLDKHNGDDAKKTRPILNLIIMVNLTWNENNQDWEGGAIYDPKSGNTYSLTCKLTDKNTLQLRGYMGISLLGRTDIWTRVIEPAPAPTK